MRVWVCVATLSLWLVIRPLLMIIHCLSAVLLRRGTIAIWIRWGAADTSAPILGRRDTVIVADLSAVLRRIVATLSRWRGLIRTACVRWVRLAGRLGGVGTVWLLRGWGGVVLRGRGLLVAVRVVVGRGFGVLRRISAVGTGLGSTTWRKAGIALLLLLGVPAGRGGIVGLLMLPWGAIGGLWSTVVVAA